VADQEDPQGSPEDSDEGTEPAASAEPPPIPPTEVNVGGEFGDLYKQGARDLIERSGITVEALQADPAGAIRQAADQFGMGDIVQTLIEFGAPAAAAAAQDAGVDPQRVAEVAAQFGITLPTQQPEPEAQPEDTATPETPAAPPTVDADLSAPDEVPSPVLEPEEPGIAIGEPSDTAEEPADAIPTETMPDQDEPLAQQNDSMPADNSSEQADDEKMEPPDTSEPPADEPGG